MSPAVRYTDSHIFFYFGVLSNHDISRQFSGARTMELLLPRLVDISHPPAAWISSRLIRNHKFNSGEQFMMACKAWLFDTDPAATTLKAILAAHSPSVQKMLGRQVRGFNEQIWTPASVEIMIASQLARSEVNETLAELYRSSGSRKFVEGSSTDRIWGVGLHFLNRAIDNPRNWKGENRLGKCHSLTREILRSQKAQPAVPMLAYRGPCRRCGLWREDDGEFSQPHARQESDCTPVHWSGDERPIFGTSEYFALEWIEERRELFKEQDLELLGMIEQEEVRVAACQHTLDKEDALPLDNLSHSTFVRFAGLSGADQLEAFSGYMVKARLREALGLRR